MRLDKVVKFLSYFSYRICSFLAGQFVTWRFVSLPMQILPHLHMRSDDLGAYAIWAKSI